MPMKDDGTHRRDGAADDFVLVAGPCDDCLLELCEASFGM